MQLEVLNLVPGTISLYWTLIANFNVSEFPKSNIEEKAWWSAKLQKVQINCLMQFNRKLSNVFSIIPYVVLHANYEELKSDFCGYLEFHNKFLTFSILILWNFRDKLKRMKFDPNSPVWVWMVHTYAGN